MKHVFRFIWWILMGALLMALVAPLFAIGAYVIYPIWTFRWYRPERHEYPENISWHMIFREWPIETWEHATGTHKESE